MGAVYSVSFDLRFKEAGYDEFNKRLRAVLKEIEASKYAVVNVPDKDTTSANMSAVLPNLWIEKDSPSGFKGDADFDASYGWETVMLDVFMYAMDACEDGSETYISIDNDYDKIEVINGRVLQTH